MKLYDMIRALIAALVASLNADTADKASLADAQAKQADLQKQLDAANAAAAANTATVADLGTPLTDDETAHLNAVLTQVQAAPPITVPAPPDAPPAQP